MYDIVLLENIFAHNFNFNYKSINQLEYVN